MKIALLAVAPLLCLAACSPPAEQSSQVPIVQMSADARATMERINTSRFTTPMSATLSESARRAPLTPSPAPAGESPTPAAPGAEVSYDAGLVRIQVLLDRAHFSPGVIDGYDGENVRKAVSAYQAANGMAVTGLADDALLTRLEQADPAPALVAHVISAQDVAGPFADVPQDFPAMSRMRHLGYESPDEALAEQFHMDEKLLRTLNPNIDFAEIGTEIVVANGGGGLSTSVASIEIDKSEAALRAFDANHQLVAFYPATIGSPDTPAPSGDYEVRSVSFDPTYHFDPARLPAFRDHQHGALTIAAGPNNPVGAVWIALSLDTYGIHGAPEPQNVSKTQSHGCVRLTNWDAIELGRAVTAGVPVRFREGTGLEAQQGGSERGG